MATERELLERRGLSDAVIQTIQSARAQSTARGYASRWRAFMQWCGKQNLDPVSCPVEMFLCFLQSLFDEGLAASTVRVYAAAISACHEGFAKTTLFSHPLVKRFLAGVCRLRPPPRASTPTWDLSLVLDALCGPPFEPLDDVSLRLLSLKTSLLLALTTAKRVSDLCALSTRADCLIISGDRTRAVLRPNPAFIPKVISRAFRAQSCELRAFFPPPHSGEEERRLHSLCPVRALSRYLECTASIRSSPQLLICYGGSRAGLPLSKQRLSHWLCEAIGLAYESMRCPVPPGIRAHSTRGVAASAAILRGVGVEEICEAASWSSPSPFVRYYLLDVSSSSFAHSVLSMAGGSGVAR